MKIIITLFLSFLGFNWSISQCVINSNITDAGVDPSSLPPASVNQFYSTDISFLVNAIPYYLVSIDGLPNGYTFNCNTQNCTYSQGGVGCVNISGMTNQYGSFPLTFNFLVTINGFPGTFPMSYNGPALVVGNLTASLSGETICSGETGNIDIAINNGVPPYTVNITDGVGQYSVSGTSPLTIPFSPIATTTYSMLSITDAIGGVGTGNSSSAQIFVNSSEFNTSFSSSQQLLTSPPFTVEFTNNTPNLSNYTFTWFWGDGTSTTSNTPTVFHQYLNNGLYTVTLEAVNNTTGCTDETTLVDYIFTTEISQCVPNSNIPAAGGIVPSSLPPASVNQFYNTDISFLLNALSYTLVSIDGLPNGFTFNCNTPNCTYPQGQIGCASISGTTNQYGLFPLTLNFLSVVNGLPGQSPFAYNGLVLVVGDLTASLSGDSICAGETGNIDIVINNGVPPYTVNITDGVNQYSVSGNSPLTIPFSPIATTTYSMVSITDAIGGVGTGNASPVQIFINSSNFNTSFSSNQQLFTSPPFAVQFSNNTPNPSNYTFIWFWGDGTSTTSNTPTVFHQYLNNGLYTVTLEAVNNTTGCTDETTLVDYIFTTGGASCTHTATINQTGPISACSGQSTVLSCNSSPSFAYQWRRNGVYISGNNNDTLLVTQPGNYSVIISDNGCPVSSTEIVVNFSTIATPPIFATGAIQPCIGGSVLLTTSSGYSSYLWSNGSNTQSTTITSSGNYSVQVTNALGCTATSAIYTVNASILPTQNICVVGVDSVSNNLRIVWEKPITTAIDSFYVYKETNVSNIYSKVGARLYDSLSVWIDPVSNPAVQAYRYKITALDSCGIETPLSDFHKSIHLTINQGVGGAWNLIWSHYEGIDFGSYNIYRGSSPNTLSLLTSIQSNLNSYTDLTPPVGDVYYQIEIVNPNNCNPTKVVNYSSSKSNVVTNAAIGIEEIYNSVYIYPNPADETIIVESVSAINEFIVFDGLGRKVKTIAGTESKTVISISELSKGHYFMYVPELNRTIRFVKK